MQKKRKHGCLKATFLFSIFLVLAGIWLWNDMNTWEFRKALPSSARDIHEWYWEDGFLPDYSYQLRAKIAEKEFLEYTQRFDMTLHRDDRIYEDEVDWLNWDEFSGFTGDWWNPDSDLVETYVWQSGDSWAFAKYSDGYIYVKGLNH